MTAPRHPERAATRARAWLYFGTAALGWGAAIASQSSLLLAIVETQLVAAAVLYVATRRSVRAIQVTRRLPASAVEGSRASVELVLDHAGWLAVELVELTDRFAGDAIMAKRVFAPRLGSGESVTLCYTIECDLGRGARAVGPVEVASGDPLGLFRCTRTLDLPGELVVHPRTLPIPTRAPLASPALHVGRHAELPRAGQSSLPLGVRELRGAPARRIHWRATARRGEPVAIQYETEGSASALVVCDLTRPTGTDGPRDLATENAIRLAAGLASRAARAGQAIGLVAHDGAPRVVPPLAGHRQLALVLDRLARLGAGSALDLVALLELATSVAPPGSELLLASRDGAVDAAALAAMRPAWRARGVETFVWHASARGPMLLEARWRARPVRMGGAMSA